MEGRIIEFAHGVVKECGVTGYRCTVGSPVCRKCPSFGGIEVRNHGTGIVANMVTRVHCLHNGGEPVKKHGVVNMVYDMQNGRTITPCYRNMGALVGGLICEKCQYFDGKSVSPGSEKGIVYCRSTTKKEVDAGVAFTIVNGMATVPCKHRKNIFVSSELCAKCGCFGGWLTASKGNIGGALVNSGTIKCTAVEKIAEREVAAVERETKIEELAPAVRKPKMIFLGGKPSDQVVTKLIDASTCTDDKSGERAASQPEEVVEGAVEEKPKEGASDLRDMVGKNLAKLRQNHKAFKLMFGVEIRQFWDNVTGFDIIKFDEWLKVPDGSSAEDFIKENYGEDAVTLVLNLM